MNPPPFEIAEHVRRHGAALRRLAMQLVGDAATADDALQETWLGALRQPPRDPRSVGGWLATLLRHVVADLRRATRRRTRREQIAVADCAPHGEDHAVVAARAELAMRLLRAVQELDAPYREAIWQRYFEGQPPRAIAAAASVPVATVKSRLQRGLGMLRVRLGEGEGAAGGDWRCAFAVAFGLGKRATTTTATAAGVGGGGILGGVLVATGAKIMAVVAAVAIAAVVWWPRTTDAPPHAPAAAVDGPVGVAVQVAAEPGAARGPEAAGPADKREAVPSLSATDVARATIRGRCVDEQGRPLADCIGELSGFTASEERMAEWLLRHARPQWSDPAAVTTRGDGVFTFHFVPPPPFRFLLEVHAEHHGAVVASWREIAEGAVIDLGDVTLRAGRRLTGRVVDGDGRPVPDTLVVANRIDERQLAPAADGEVRPGSASARSDVSGELVFAPTLSTGSYAIESKGAPQLAPLVAEIGGDREPPPVVVVVDRPEQVSIRGRVIDDAGQPVAEASVRGEPIPRGFFWRTATDGSFEVHMPRRDAQGPIDVVAECEGYEGRAVARAVAWGRDEVVLTLPRAAQLELRVVDAQGKPVEDFAARLLSRKHLRSTDCRVRSRGPFAGGVATIPGVERGSWLAVIAFPDGSGLADASVPFVVETAGVVRVLATARVLGERRARVVDEAGQPVAEAELVVCEPLDGVLDATTLLVTVQTHSQVTGPSKALILAKAITDAAGFATLRGPLGQPLALALPGKVHVPMFVRDVRLDEPTPLVVTVPRGVRLRARLPSRAVAALRCMCGVPEDRAFGAERRPLLLLVGANGRTVPNLSEAIIVGTGPGRMQDGGSLVIAGLRPERYTMCLLYWPTGGGVEQLEVGPVDLTNGEDRDVDIDLPQLTLGTITGSLSVNGDAAVLRHMRFEGAARKSLVTDGAGRFTATVPTGTYRVLAPLSNYQSEAWVPLAEAVTVRADAVTTLALSVQSGRLRVRLLDAEGRPAAHVTMVARLGGSTSASSLPSTAADGTLDVELPVGMVTLALDAAPLPRPGRAPGAPQAVVDLGTATIRAGETATLELRLPTGQGK